MNYIRLFENFHSSYRNIESSEFNTILHNNYLKHLDEDFNKTSLKIKRRYPKWKFENTFSFVSDGKFDGIICEGEHRKFIVITFLRDEWFLVQVQSPGFKLDQYINNSFYECDQLGGLYDLLDTLYLDWNF